MEYISLSANDIRLLHLAPGSFEEEEIQCRFTTVSLDGPFQHEALSYAWGNLTKDRRVYVDGHSMLVTANLYSALRHLRNQDHERTLWVDALCINQDDPRERMHQVSRMSKIYGQAVQVVVWLGEGWDGSDMAMEFLRRLGSDATLHLVADLSPNVTVDGLNLNLRELRGHIIRIFNTAWWKRTWTVQEFVLARKLIFQCSKVWISGEMMFMSRENFWWHNDRCCPHKSFHEFHPEQGMSLGQAFAQAADLDYMTISRGFFESVLIHIAMFCEREVTDPRDRIYGMLGLGTGDYVNLVEPDYTLSPEEVCEAVAMKSLKVTQRLEFLSHLFEHQNPRLPSFIPNWTGPYAWSGTYASRLSNIKWFSASGNMMAGVTSMSNGVLTLRGIIFDEVRATGAASFLDNMYTKEPCAMKELRKLGGIEESHASNENYCHTNNSRLMAFWDTLCGGMQTTLKDRNRYRERLQPSSDFSRYFRWVNYFEGSQQTRTGLWDTELDLIMHDVRAATYDRRFFMTKKGYFGFGPRSCQEGDLVVILAGGRVPYIIRPLTRESQRFEIEKRYNIFGDAYIHGIMDGEALNLLNKTEQDLEDIILV